MFSIILVIYGRSITTTVIDGFSTAEIATQAGDKAVKDLSFSTDIAVKYSVVKKG